MAWYSSSFSKRILKDCEEKALQAANEALDENYDLTLSYLNSFYGSYSPERYTRTNDGGEYSTGGSLYDSLEVEWARIVGNKVKGRVYYDYAGKGYISYYPSGINPSMFKVIGWIESGGIPCRPVATPSIWRVPKASFKDNLNSAFSKYFHR